MRYWIRISQITMWKHQEVIHEIFDELGRVLISSELYLKIFWQQSMLCPLMTAYLFFKLSVLQTLKMLGLLWYVRCAYCDRWGQRQHQILFWSFGCNIWNLSLSVMTPWRRQHQQLMRKFVHPITHGQSGLQRMPECTLFPSGINFCWGLMKLVSIN